MGKNQLRFLLMLCCVGAACAELEPGVPDDSHRPRLLTSSSDRSLARGDRRAGPPVAILQAGYVETFQTGDIVATFLGTSSLFITDGYTNLLIDGFFSRPSLLGTLYLKPDLGRIDAMLAQLAQPLHAVFVVHSHHDHVMDAPHIAHRTGANLFGSPSTYNVVRGYGLERQVNFVLADYNTTWAIGGFEVTFRRSLHAETLLTDAERPGFITKPLRRRLFGNYSVRDFKEGRVYSIHFAHRSGWKFIVQASDNIDNATLAGLTADVIFLGAGTSRNQTQWEWDRYVSLAVDGTYAQTVVPIHWDDFFTPFVAPLEKSRFSDLYRVRNSIAGRGLQYMELDAWQRIVMPVLR